ncbi:MAG: hypothetical protein DRJ05_18375, partial [Bacteroidetes bacterium]
RAKAAEIVSVKKTHHKSISTEITKERLMYLNKKSEKNVSIEYFDLTSEDGNPLGTKVEMLIPYSLGSN